jgi:hypothetical protein
LEISLNIQEKFCPVCKNKNDRLASVCIHCGAQLGEISSGMAKTTRNTGGIFVDPTNIPEPTIDIDLIPEDGLAISIAGTLKPFYLRIQKEFVIGRKLEKTSETFLDLSRLDGFNMGISRQHLMIRRAEAGYEVIDLSTTNGTWMNGDRLVPERPYPLQNGAQLRLGRLRLLIRYHSSDETRKEEQA